MKLKREDLDELRALEIMATNEALSPESRDSAIFRPYEYALRTTVRNVLPVLLDLAKKGLEAEAESDELRIQLDVAIKEIGNQSRLLGREQAKCDELRALLARNPDEAGARMTLPQEAQALTIGEAADLLDAIAHDVNSWYGYANKGCLAKAQSVLASALDRAFLRGKLDGMHDAEIAKSGEVAKA